MADTINFTEGMNYVLQFGLPATPYFLLSTNAVSSFATPTTLAGGVGEITGTGYSRQLMPCPPPIQGSVYFTQMSWSTGSATNWPNNVKSVLTVTSSDNSGKAICAQNLIPGGGTRDLSQANTIEQVTPTIGLS